MQLQIECKVLRDALSRLLPVVDKKNTIPVLSNILFAANADMRTVQLTANNLEQAMSVTIPVTDTTGGSITIPAQKLSEIVKELPDAAVTLSVDEKNWITLECRKSTFKLAGLPQTDFPNVPAITEDARTVTLPPAVLRDMISKTAFAVSHDDSRYALTGVQVNIQADLLQMVATDGHRLVRAERAVSLEYAGDPTSVIVPLRGMIEVKKLCDQGEDVHLVICANHLAFTAGNVRLFSRLIDAQFPDWKQVFPETFARHIVADKDEFARALRRVALLCSETRLMKVNLSPSTLLLQASDPNQGEAQETVPVEYEGDALLIGFNARYIMDWLATTGGIELTLQFNDPLSPGLFTANGVDDAGCACIIMPMRI